MVDQSWEDAIDTELSYDADGNLLAAQQASTTAVEKWKSEIYHAQGATAGDAYDRLNRLKGYNRGVMNSDQRSVSQSGIDIITGVEAVPTQYLSEDQYAANSGTGDYQQSQPAGTDYPPNNVYQKPLPAGTTSFALGSENQHNERDMFLTFDAWGRLTTQSQAYLEGDGQSNNFYKGWFTNDFVYDALGRRVSENETHLDSSQSTTTRPCRTPGCFMWRRAINGGVGNGEGRRHQWMRIR